MINITFLFVYNFINLKTRRNLRTFFFRTYDHSVKVKIPVRNPRTIRNRLSL